jgi:hypothetical protein
MGRYGQEFVARCEQASGRFLGSSDVKFQKKRAGKLGKIRDESLEAICRRRRSSQQSDWSVGNISKILD